MTESRGLPARGWLPEGLQRLAPGVAGGARYRLGLPGRGSPSLVLLPGIEGDARVFLRLEPLARRWPVQAHDLPPRAALDVAAISELLDADLPPGPLVLVGASLGGLVARCVAARWPRRVRGLVTIGSLPERLLLPAGLSRRAVLAGHLPEGAWRRLYRRRLARLLAEEGVHVDLAAELLEGLPPAWLHGARMAAIRAWGVPPGCPVPTLSLRGQVDREAPWRGADVARALPQSGFETVPGGHRPHLTHPEALVVVLSRFVESLG